MKNSTTKTNSPKNLDVLTEKQLLKLSKEQRIELIKSRLRADALAFVADNEPDVQKFLDFFGPRVLEISGADQVIFRRVDGTRMVYNAHRVKDIPSKICAKCPFVDLNCGAYDPDGVVVLNDSRNGCRGFHAPVDCPSKSSVMQQVYAEGSIVGAIAVHYLHEYHTFTHEGLEIMKTIATYLGLLLERIYAKSRRSETVLLERLKESDKIIGALTKDYGGVNYIEFTDNPDHDITLGYRTSVLMKKLVPGWEHVISFAKRLDILHDQIVYEPDKAEFYRLTRRDYIQDKLKESETYSIYPRLVIGNEIQYFEIKFSSVVENGELKGMVAGFHSIDQQRKKELEYQNRLRVALEHAQEANAKIAEQSVFTSHFLKPYRTAYYADLNTHEALVYKSFYEPRMEGTVMTNFFDAMLRRTEEVVDAKDRARLRDMFSPEKIRTNLKRDDVLTCVFRDTLVGDERYVRLEIIPGADMDHIALGFKDITNELNS